MHCSRCGAARFRRSSHGVAPRRRASRRRRLPGALPRGAGPGPPTAVGLDLLGAARGRCCVHPGRRLGAVPGLLLEAFL